MSFPFDEAPFCFRIASQTPAKGASPSATEIFLTDEKAAAPFTGWLIGPIGEVRFRAVEIVALKVPCLPLYGQYILGKPANGIGDRAIYQPTP